MPHYTFHNKDTGKEFIEEFSIADKEIYLEKNKNIEQIFNTMTIGDPVRLGKTKAPSDFSKYILGKVKERNPLGNVERKAGTIPREW
jgi:hypothetical protein